MEMNATDKEIMLLSYQIMQKTKTRTKAYKKINNGMLKTQSFCGTGRQNINLDTHNVRIYIMKLLRKHVIDWYQTYLMNPGANKTYDTMHQNLYWTGLQIEVNYAIKKCETFQQSKKSNRKFGHLAQKEAESYPYKNCVLISLAHKKYAEKANINWILHYGL